MKRAIVAALVVGVALATDIAPLAGAVVKFPSTSAPPPARPLYGRALVANPLLVVQSHDPARMSDRSVPTTRKERRRRHRDAVARARAAQQAQPQAAAPEVGVPSQLQAIAACESGGNPAAVGGGGLYRGKYQMTYSAWQSVGGSGDPAAAPEGEQDRRAALLYAQSGAAQWPVGGG
jgi:hypothetical protein